MCLTTSWIKPSKMSDFSFGSGISSIPFSLKATWACASLISASYVKRGMQNKSGHEDRDDVDSGDERVTVLSPEVDVSSRALVDGKENVSSPWS